MHPNDPTMRLVSLWCAGTLDDLFGMGYIVVPEDARIPRDLVSQYRVLDAKGYRPSVAEIADFIGYLFEDDVDDTKYAAAALVLAYANERFRKSLIEQRANRDWVASEVVIESQAELNEDETIES